jgi:hypothetical protein
MCKQSIFKLRCACIFIHFAFVGGSNLEDLKCSPIAPVQHPRIEQIDFFDVPPSGCKDVVSVYTIMILLLAS